MEGLSSDYARRSRMLIQIKTNTFFFFLSAVLIGLYSAVSAGNLVIASRLPLAHPSLILKLKIKVTDDPPSIVSKEKSQGSTPSTTASKRPDQTRKLMKRFEVLQCIDHRTKPCFTFLELHCLIPFY